jgi:hypothetical protein
MLWQPLSGIVAMVHVILAIRARPGFAAGGWIPTIACGMTRIWRPNVKKRFTVPFV